MRGRWDCGGTIAIAIRSDPSLLPMHFSIPSRIGASCRNPAATALKFANSIDRIAQYSIPWIRNNSRLRSNTVCKPVNCRATSTPERGHSTHSCRMALMLSTSDETSFDKSNASKAARVLGSCCWCVKCATTRVRRTTHQEYLALFGAEKIGTECFVSVSREQRYRNC